MTMKNDLASNPGYLHNLKFMKSWYEQHNCVRSDVRIFRQGSFQVLSHSFGEHPIFHDFSIMIQNMETLHGLRND